MYDYLIVGAGIYGSVFAYEAAKRGKTCLVIDKRNHIGGNMYTERVHGINVHKYGPHIFHTNDEKIWNYINKFTSFNQFVYNPVANYEDRLYNLPFNMHTFYQLWGIKDPNLVLDKINEQKGNAEVISNLEEQAISMVGSDIYEVLIKGYTEKQWGKKCNELPKSIIKRLPVRLTFNNNYFNDKFQGMPANGYTDIFINLLKGIEVRLATDYFGNRDYFNSLARKIVYTGPIDKFFDYKYGQLEYRSLEFETNVLNMNNYQGIYVMNYTSSKIPYTRVIEHKHFDNNGDEGITIVTKEHPKTGTINTEPYYPVNDEKNNKIFLQYRKESEMLHNVIMGGRLGEYKYYDMHQVIASALNMVSKELL
ncbi:MAG: UDP-galactopyranose mutase [Bacteroidetes bacterium]|nr:UDP-galactopyranose mutase [Bacteroidota bacterium]